MKFPNIKKSLLIMFAMLTCLLSCAQSEQKRVCFMDNCFNVELAITPQKRSRGLMFRRRLARNKGMLFLFEEEGEYGFWMKNTSFPLDIIWINKEREAVFIKKNAQPCKKDTCPAIYPHKKARYVLEVNAGVVGNMGLEVGDSLSFYIEGLTRPR